MTITTYSQARELLEKYPYFAYAALKAIPLAPDADARRKMKALVAANVGEETELREILNLNSESLTDFYPDELPPQLSTSETIDSFLDRFGGNLPQAHEDGDPLQQIPIIPAAPYIPGENAAPALAASATAVSNPIASNPVAPKLTERENPQPATAEKTESKNKITESFARILVKNGNYAKALAIIEDLNLKNPEKSIYFADQIRFLKKLMINQSKIGNRN